ncbi:MAG TPA: hypothetical protein VMU09_04370, partial [Acidimicrobiales bacterium]|nr:hypothetical protein [Acidimicrobiales bacterium]
MTAVVPGGSPAAPLPHLGGLGAYEGDEFDDFDAPAEAGAGAGAGAQAGPDDGDDDAGASTDDAGASTDDAGGGAAARRSRWAGLDLDPDELLEGLNDPQRRAVEYRGGPL